MPRWHFVIINVEASVLHCQLADFAPTMESLSMGVCLHDTYTNILYLCANKPLNSKSRKIERFGRLEQFGVID